VFPEDLFKDLQKDCAKLGSHSTETKSFMHGKKMTYFMRTNAQGNKREGKVTSAASRGPPRHTVRSVCCMVLC
jgi:hypothetical protein